MPSRRQGAMITPAVMRSSVTLGRIGGVAIGINWSWLIVFGLIVWSLAAEVFPEANPGLADGVYVAMAIAATAMTPETANTTA